MIEKLINKNENGINDKLILEQIKNTLFCLGVKDPITDYILINLAHVTFLTSLSPDEKGSALLVFLNEELLKERNDQAYVMPVDYKAIIEIIDHLGSVGIVIISSEGWVYFTSEQIRSLK